MVVFLCWCFCAGVFVVCFCGDVFVVVFFWCGCGGVFVAVFLWWCTKVLLQFYKVLLQYHKVRLQYYSVLLQYYSVPESTPVLLRTTKYCSSTTKYYSVLQSTTPVLQSTTLHNKVISSTTTKHYSSTTPYYRALLRPLKRRQNDVLPVLLRTAPVLQKLPKRAFRARLPQLFTEKASKMIVSCEASSKFHRTSFENERFARCFRQFSQKKLPKGSFRAMLLPNFTEQASKTGVSHDASSKFHKTSFQNDRFVRGFLQISQCSLNERFARCFRQFSPKICVSLQFRVIDRPIPTKGFIRQKQNVPRTTTPCIPKCENVRFASAPCAKMHESIHCEPTRFAHTKM